MSDTSDSVMGQKKSNLSMFGKYWYLDIVLLLVILAGGYLRTVGISWDEDQHLHPDERFLTMVENDIRPVSSLAEYFDTDASSLNPQNSGKSFFVYGDFPIILVRYIAEWTGQTGYNSVHVVGRLTSALFDLFTLLVIYLIGHKAYDRRIGLLAAILYSFSALAIQLSHFFAVDTFLTFFVTLGIYAAVSLYKHLDRKTINDSVDEKVVPVNPWTGIGWYLLFGFALALAMASKYNAVALAVILPVTVFAWFAKLPIEKRYRWIVPMLVNLVITALFAFLLFRIAQPYAFKGPGFFGILPNPKIVENIRELSLQTDGTADFPPALQWARRPKTFAFENLFRWGMGWPLGILVWGGFIWMAIRLFRRKNLSHLPIWLWAGGFFIWQAMGWNPMLRYTLPAYPTLVIIGAWLIFHIWDCRKKSIDASDLQIETKPWWTRIVAALLLAGVVLPTGAWAYAFSTIYTRPVTRIEASRWIYQNIPGPINLKIQTSQGVYNQPLSYPQGAIITPGNPVEYDISARTDGVLQSFSFFRVVDTTGIDQDKDLQITLTDVNSNLKIAEAHLTSKFLPAQDFRGQAYSAQSTPEVQLVKDHRYRISLSLTDGSGMLVIQGSAPANESDWDDGLPLRIDNYDGYGGIYTGGLNFEMYWDDNEEKRERFTTTLDQADYIFMSSNRQWGTTTRVPERYPMTTAFYRALIGCPQDKEILWCYTVGQPGMFQGSLGFDLVQVFQSNPTLNGISINDQAAEESFTVYDHPKVFIFQKRADYDSQATARFFGGFDLTKVIHVPLNQVPLRPQTLLLPASNWTQQQLGGTWSDLFKWNDLQNKYPGVGVVLWYVVVLILGLVFLPTVRLAFPGLKDRGYGYSRLTGLLFLALITWLLGSVGVPFTRLTISLVFVVLVIMNAFLAYLQREEWVQYFREERRSILITEAIFLGFFALDLLVRIGNPDIWHPYKGGEKPMDFSYLNAVIKSTTFPPYDPWYAGGYINYYYYGFVIVGVLVKWLGIVPSIAYNIILPTLFSMLATGAYSLISNIVRHIKATTEEGSSSQKSPYLFGLFGAFFVAVIGNLASIRMIWYGLQRLAAPDGQIAGAPFLTRMIWTAKGLVELFQGRPLPFYPGDWYWIPSRAIPAPNDVEPITEFPAFTFLYADLHAHMIALPITVMVIGWLVSFILAKGRSGLGNGRNRGLGLGIALFVGAMTVGALRPTNTWDFPVYLALCLVGLTYLLLRWKDSFAFDILADRNIPQWLIGAGIILLFSVASVVLYQPYSYWYGAGYTSIELWHGPTTPSWSYLAHWGFFLFIISTWLTHETIDWMAVTPLRKLGELRPHFKFYIGVLAVFVVAILICYIIRAWVGWIVLPLSLWSAVLLFRPNQSDIKRIFLFFIGTGLILTLVVEIIVLKGDIARMNTVFKFYMQVWTLLALTSAVSLYFLLHSLPRWNISFQNLFQSVLWLLMGCTFLFPILGGIDKIRDRMVETAPHSLDGMSYMVGATYMEDDVNYNDSKVMQLEQDYHAIRWMQENVKGSPVIVEGNVPEYRWGTRYTIYTGLPNVIGWNWHQRQQRAINPSEWIFDRVNEVGEFYSTTDINKAIAFIHKYNVKYVVVGQLEMAIYPLSGLAKFYQYEGQYWKPVYTNQETTIYEVIP